jgi:hypothetical protein
MISPIPVNDFSIGFEWPIVAGHDLQNGMSIRLEYALDVVYEFLV